MLNSDLIQWIESTPDTIITLTSGEKMMIRESIEEVTERVMDFRKRMHQEPPRKPTSAESQATAGSATDKAISEGQYSGKKRV